MIFIDLLLEYVNVNLWAARTSYKKQKTTKIPIYENMSFTSLFIKV